MTKELIFHHSLPSILEFKISNIQDSKAGVGGSLNSASTGKIYRDLYTRQAVEYKQYKTVAT